MISIKNQKEYVVALESVAMTDIVMNLFIFFFISFSLLATFNPSRQAFLDVNLPSAQHARLADQAPGECVIAVCADGSYRLDGKPQTIESIRAFLSERRTQVSASGILFTIDRDVPFQYVAGALDMAEGLGIERVRIATQDERAQAKRGHTQ